MPGPFTLSKQAQDDFYGDAEAMALDYAAALNAEIKDLFAAGADIVQIDEPWMQQHPERRAALRPQGARPGARRRDRHGRRASVLRLRGAGARQAVGLFVPARAGELESAAGLHRGGAAQASTSAMLQALPSKTIILGVIDLADMKVETPEIVAARIRRALDYVPARTPRRGARLRHEVPAAAGRLRQDESDGRRRRAGAAGDCGW